MQNKTIVMIGNTSWGMFHFRSGTIKEFISRGHRVIVLAPKDESSHHFQSLNCEYQEISIDRKGSNPITELSSIKELTGLLLTFKPDVVLSYTIKPVLYGTIAAKLASVKKIIAITTGLGFVFNHNNPTTRIAKLLYKYVLKFADEVWFLNQEDEKIFLRSNLIKKEKTFVLPGEGVDIDHYSPSDEKSSVTTFTLISRMLWDKGVGVFVESAKVLKRKHPQIKFQILGPIDEGNPEGISLRQLEDWNKEGSIEYLGATSDIRPILNKTSCLVHPTYYKEGLPRILIEACSMEIPCITTNTPGCSDVIENNKNGFLVEPKNVDSLIDAMEKFINLSQDEKNNLSKNSRQKICDQFALSIINEIYLSRIEL